MLVKTFSSSVQGISAAIITVEVNITPGIKFSIVGLADNAVKESHQRIESALKNNGYHWPGKKIIVNMAPADIRKEGSAYDLSIAMGVMAASEQLSSDIMDKYVMMGELSLDGGIQRVRGILPISIRAKEDGFRGLIVPQDNALEAAVVEGLEVIGVSSIRDVIGFLRGD